MTPDLRQEHDRQDASQAQELTRTPGGKNMKPLSNCVCGKNRWQEQNMWQELQAARTGYPLWVAPVKNMQHLSYKKYLKNITSAKKLNLLNHRCYIKASPCQLQQTLATQVARTWWYVHLKNITGGKITKPLLTSSVYQSWYHSESANRWPPNSHRSPQWVHKQIDCGGTIMFSKNYVKQEHRKIDCAKERSFKINLHCTWLESCRVIPIFHPPTYKRWGSAAIARTKTTTGRTLNSKTKKQSIHVQNVNVHMDCAFAALGHSNLAVFQYIQARIFKADSKW